VFIDDSPVERARVREALPEVLVPDWPADPMRFAAALTRLRCFDVPAVTREDAVRTQMYVSERTRSELLSRVGSVDAWLKSLDIHVHVEPVADGVYDRVLQLLNKTNQLNLRTRRLTEAEFRAWQAGDGRQSWCFRVSDRLGDSGITGLLSLEHVGDVAEVCDFVLSCRVMGRKVEETMLHVAVEYARAAGLRDVRARYEPTRKNAPCLEFLKRSGLTAEDDGRVFVWSTGEPYPLPEPIRCTR
jgi:FkbH-like protein